VPALCPLRKKLTVEQITDSTHVAGQEFQECLYEKCAWYDTIHEECCVRLLAKFFIFREALRREA